MTFTNRGIKRKATEYKHIAFNAYVCLLFIIATISFLSGCKKDDSGDEQQDSQINISSGILVVNEGNFQWGNASISFYNLSDGSVTPDIFYAVNNRPLGDVAQSICMYNNNIYIVVNNSGKVEIISSSDFKSKGTITGLTSPRYFAGINAGKAYVSDLYSNSISVIDLNTNQKVSSIPCPGSTEEIIIYNSKAYVSNTRKSCIYIIDPQSDLITDSISTSYAPNSMVFDKYGKLWVICMGNNSPEINAHLQKINVDTKTTELDLSFQTPLNIWNKLSINSTLDTLYFLNNGVFRMDITSDNLPSSPFILQGNKNFYGLGIEFNTGNIYVTDAIDYIQKGDVMIYSSFNGALIKSFKAGIIPSSVYYYNYHQ